jgi:hypothetical protein
MKAIWLHMTCVCEPCQVKRLLNVKCSLNLLMGDRMAWVVLLTDDVADWLAELNKEDPESAARVAASIEMLKEHGPALDRPLVDTIKSSKIANLKELRPGSSGRKKIRLLFVFDRWRQAILLVAGDKSSNWQGWYKSAIERAERLYDEHLRTQQKEREEGKRDAGS